MRFPNPYMLLEIGKADAFCVAVEYVDPKKYPELFEQILKFDRYLKHPKYQLGAGLYTDDTEMSVANALVLIENDPPYTPMMFADAYVREFLRGGKRKGYSKGFQAILEKSSTGQELVNNLIPTSVANGAAMRAVPIGVLRTVPEVLDVATMQAKITHDTPEGLFSARAIALMSHFALYEKVEGWVDWCLNGLKEYCLNNLPEEDVERFGHVFREPWIGKPVIATDEYSVAINTVHAVMDVIYYACGYGDRRALEAVIRMGGDTDSVAAIAMGIISCRPVNEVAGPPIQPFSYIDLENGDPRTGAKYLLDVGRRLMEKFKS